MHVVPAAHDRLPAAKAPPAQMDPENRGENRDRVAKKQRTLQGQQPYPPPTPLQRAFINGLIEGRLNPHAGWGRIRQVLDELDDRRFAEACVAAQVAPNDMTREAATQCIIDRAASRVPAVPSAGAASAGQH